jgi:hypothetical protein
MAKKGIATIIGRRMTRLVGKKLKVLPGKL